jgi:hypothetical protein
MSDTKTADNLIYKAASILGKAVAGEALGAVEYQTIDNCVDDVLEEISEIVYIGDRDEIPRKYFLTIARLLAINAAAEFAGTEPDPDQITKQESRLRFLVARDPSYQTMQGHYF